MNGALAWKQGTYRCGDLPVWTVYCPAGLLGNSTVIEGDDGLTLIDGGWSIPVARDLLDRSLRSIGSGFGDIRRFLVTHVHRDHFTLATVLGHEYGAEVSLGAATVRCSRAGVPLTSPRPGCGSFRAGR